MTSRRTHTYLLLSALLIMTFVAIPFGRVVRARIQPKNFFQEIFRAATWSSVVPPADRFEVLADFYSEAVLDRNTGLVWQLAPSTQRFVWVDARSACMNSASGGRRGWRLPSIVEVNTLQDPGSPAVPLNAPFVLPDDPAVPRIFWSATSDAADPTDAWFASFDVAVSFSGEKSRSHYAWCVYAAMTAHQY